MIQRFPREFAHCVQMQVPISNILGDKEANSFLSQRVDFFVSFPLGSCFVLEPGDHDDPKQKALDDLRDKAFSEKFVSTIRLKNEEIYQTDYYEKLFSNLLNGGLSNLILADQPPFPDELISLNYILLLPSLIARIDYMLAHFFFHHGLANRSELSIGVIERDLECTVLAIADFRHLVLRLSELFDLNIEFPLIHLYIKNNKTYSYADFSSLDIEFSIVDTFTDLNLDLILDVGIKCNPNTIPVSSGAPHVGSVRQTYPHNKPVTFAYLSENRSITNTDNTEFLLESFLQDFFRKLSFRPGQYPIIKNILRQKDTIGLLPTSAGKSICYQLASLLTPGSTLIVDPINALMKNQVDSLRKFYGIDRVYAWYGRSSPDVSSLLYGCSMIFISPERLQRKSFRSAMQNLKVSDIFINYVVIDESHCVSMWGHDFRPSYLMLKNNIENYCKIGNNIPSIVALTGTASQLVLIDLKRELRIDDLDSIIRPKSFNREELTFNLVKCSNDKKNAYLKSVEDAIARRLNVSDLSQEAHGIIFAYTPKELLQLLSFHMGDYHSHVSRVLRSDPENVTYGLFCGGMPHGFPVSSVKAWEKYKENILDLFQHGQVRMLFGNNAISVGIDNPKINYIINYKMPQSLESYYQQCGRAGRDNQHSECYLIFSDDNPVKSQAWLDRQISKMGERYDDLGTVSYFHENNFPGKDIDSKNTLIVFRQLFKDPFNNIVIDNNVNGMFTTEEAKNTEKYISYLSILGLIQDYEVSGINDSTKYFVKLSNEVERYFRVKDNSILEQKFFQSITDYLSRYRPVTLENIRTAINSRKESGFAERCVGFLIDFVYDQIEYQRREAIRTMVNFCNEKDTSSSALRSRLVAYFDNSEKFSKTLLLMAQGDPKIDLIKEVCEKVENFNDGETLFYETRRYLDEQLRPDWQAANMFALVFRGGGKFSDAFANDLISLIDQFSQSYDYSQKQIIKFLSSYLSIFKGLDNLFSTPLGVEFISRSIYYLYKNFGSSYLGCIEELAISKDYRKEVELMISNHQIKEILNAHYSRIVG